MDEFDPFEVAAAVMNLVKNSDTPRRPSRSSSSPEPQS
jgi:hypothetical protein